MVRIARWCLCVTLAAIALLGASRAPAAEAEAAPVRAQRLAHVLRYLDADYARFGAREQREHLAMAAGAARMAQGLPGPEGLTTRVAAVGALLERLAPATEIHARVAELSADLAATYRIERTPADTPSLARGRALYEANCAGCHGVTGRADTAAAAVLRPHPASFQDPLFGETLSPYDVTTAIRFGVDGTAMVPVTSLPEGDRWDIAFYVLGLRHSGPTADAAPSLTPGELAVVTDAELRDQLRAAGVRGESLDATLHALRRRVAFEAGSRGGSLGAARGMLDAAEARIVRGDREGALVAVQGALADGWQPSESGLAAVDPTLVARVRKTFARLTDLLRSGTPAVQVTPAIRGALDLLTHAEHVLDEANGRRASVPPAAYRAELLARDGLLAALAMGAVFAALRLRKTTARSRAPHLAWIGTVGVGLVATLGLATTRLASGSPEDAAAFARAWPVEAPASASTEANPAGRPPGSCAEPGFSRGPELRAVDGGLPFEVTHDCLFPGRVRLEVAVNVSSSERPRRAQIDALLRALFEQVRSATAPTVPDLTHVCAFPAGTIEGKNPYGCLEFEGDEGPQGELSVHVDVPFEPSEWIPGFAAGHSRGFTGIRKPDVTVDDAGGEVVVTYPFVEDGTDRWADHLTAVRAAEHFFPWIFDFYPARTDLQALTFRGVWQGKIVFTVHVADLKTFLAMNPWPIRERMAAAGIPLDPSAARTAQQDATLAKEYAVALKRLPAGSVVVDPSLGKY